MIVNQPKLFIALCLLLISGNAFAQCVVGVTCPPNIVTVADSGTCGAIASYASPTATNSCTIAGTVTFNYTAPALQTFTVPTGVTSINIDASGAQGGSVTVSCPATGGLGARMQGDFAVTPGEVLSIMVGQAGLTNGSDAGGGGGTFVVRTGNVLLVAAGGGGGATNDIGQCRVLGNGSDASITTTGNASGNGQEPGGTNGNGGEASSGSGGGGGGFLTNGIAGTGLANNNGKSYLNGGVGGTGNNNDSGGYGGGGAGWFTGGNGGGGGGYSGGATSGSQPFTGGGGGGSYNIGTNQVNTAGFQTGNGRVIITYSVVAPTYVSMIQGAASGSTFPVGITPIVYMATDSAGASDSCSFTVTVQDTTAPTISCTGSILASNDAGTCGAVVTYAAPVSLDECPGVITTLDSGLVSGAVFPVGSTTVVYEAEDSSGNAAYCSFVVTVLADDSSSQSLNICDGSSVSVGTSTYSVAGTYVDTLANGGGCDSVVTTILTVAAPIDVTTSISGGTITAAASNATYQWLNCDSGVTVISGATNQSFAPAIDGNYAVIVTVGNCSDTSSCSVVVGIAEGLSGQFVVYPNPTTGRIEVAFGTTLDVVQVEVFDLAGKRLLTKTEANAATTQLDFSNLVNGIYVVKLSTNAGQEVLRVVKQD
ncbi:MAG: HYR domain-containing protein [Bacteroidetes bacterium]|nr:HYR domain-containing protein [Bacteroidota bacterium]MBP6640383.1 HYR domain-containing protein [Bacteroidia bacterium]